MPAASFEDVYLVNPAHVRPSTSGEVTGLESELGVRMPTGYDEYVRRLGDGALGHLVRVYPPTTLGTRTSEWRARVQEYWFWDTTAAGVEPESFQDRGVVVADTFDGDELCFLPEDPDALFLLPRDDDDVVPAGPASLPGPTSRSPGPPRSGPSTTSRCGTSSACGCGRASAGAASPSTS